MVSPPPPGLRTAAPEWVTDGIRAADACPTPASKNTATRTVVPKREHGTCRTAPADSSNTSTAPSPAARSTKRSTGAKGSRNATKTRPKSVGSGGDAATAAGSLLLALPGVVAMLSSAVSSRALARSSGCLSAETTHSAETHRSECQVGAKPVGADCCRAAGRGHQCARSIWLSRAAWRVWWSRSARFGAFWAACA